MVSPTSLVNADKLRAALPHASASFLRLNGLSAPIADSRIRLELAPLPITPNPKTAKKPRAARVPRTRNAGTWTEAQFWQRIRSCLRRMSVYWRPAREALQAARIPCKGPHGQKWAFRCADCEKLFPRKLVQLDHETPCGSLTAYEHIGPFLERLLPEDPNAYKVRCLDCHQAKTNAERQTKP